MANVGECAVVHVVLVHDLDEQSINDIANCFVFCKEEKVVIAFFYLAEFSSLLADL